MEIHADLLFVLHLFIAEYKTLCPGGEGFRPNPITVILEGTALSAAAATVTAKH